MKRRLDVLLATAAMAALVLAAGGGAIAAPVTTQRTEGTFTATDVAPDGGATGVPVDVRPSVSFDQNPTFDSVTGKGNVSLKKVGARKPVRFSLGYNYTTNTLELIPFESLKPDTRYRVKIQGGRRGLETEQGATLMGVTDPTAVFNKDKQVVWTFRTAP